MAKTPVKVHSGDADSGRPVNGKGAQRRRGRAPKGTKLEQLAPAEVEDLALDAADRVKLRHCRKRIGQLSPHPLNTRTHTPEQVDKIAGLIRRFGFTNPVLCDEAGLILAGHARVDAAQLLAMDWVPAIEIQGLTDREKRELMLADNKIALNAGWNEELLRAELDAMRVDGVDLEALGFSVAEVDSLLPGEPTANVEELQLGPVADRFWISVKGPLRHQADALQRLRALMADLQGISVELGTITDE